MTNKSSGPLSPEKIAEMARLAISQHAMNVSMNCSSTMSVLADQLAHAYLAIAAERDATPAPTVTREDESRDEMKQMIAEDMADGWPAELGKLASSPASPAPVVVSVEVIAESVFREWAKAYDSNLTLEDARRAGETLFDDTAAAIAALFPQADAEKGGS